MSFRFHNLTLTIFRFLGSIQFAMVLLGVIIIASIFGTFMESGFNAAVAQAYVYDAPWFIFWLLLLCTNLTIAVVVRYPWKPHQWGFVITHAGIVVILAGGIIGSIWGIEGNMTLRADGTPADFLIVNETLLQVQKSGEKVHSFPLKLKLREPEPERPLRFRAGETDITVLQIANELGIRHVVEPAGSQGSPALRLIVESDAAPHPIDQWLISDNPQRSRLALGDHVIRFAGNGTTVAATSGNGDTTATSREVHFAFARVDGMNVSRVVSGVGSGATASYRFENGDNAGDTFGVLELNLNGRSFALDISEILDETDVLDDTGWRLENVRYFPDFRMEGKELVSVSDEPNNSAIVFELSGPRGNPETDECCATGPAAAPKSPVHAEDEDDSCCAADPVPFEQSRLEPVTEDACCAVDSPDAPVLNAAGPPGEDSCCASDSDSAPVASTGNPHTGSKGTNPASKRHGSDDDCCKTDGIKTVRNGGNGHELILRYEAEKLVYESHTGNGIETAEVELGVAFSAGWKDWSFRVEELVEHAAIRTEYAPMKSAGMESTGASGLLVRLENGDHSVQRWVEMGRTTFVALGDKHLHMGFGFRLHPLDFQVQLERFEVEFNAGTRTPASFKSHLVFTSDSDETLSRAVWMNNPTNFPSFLGAGLLGTSYKFSQSSWNPGDLSQTTLQVIRDPGWSLKWIGSLLFCSGILMIFYLKPYPRFARKAENPSSSTSESAKAQETSGAIDRAGKQRKISVVAMDR